MSMQIKHLSSNEIKAEIKRLQKELRRREEPLTLSPKEKCTQRRLKKTTTTRRRRN